MSDPDIPETPPEHVAIPVHEEVLEPRTRDVEVGTVRIRKRVETVPSETAVEAGRDEVSIERVRVDRPVDAVPAPRQEGETLIIPVVEEVLVTETRLVVREEIRITRRRVTERVPVRADLRREVVEIEELQPGTSATPPPTAEGR